MSFGRRRAEASAASLAPDPTELAHRAAVELAAPAVDARGASADEGTSDAVDVAMADAPTRLTHHGRALRRAIAEQIRGAMRAARTMGQAHGGRGAFEDDPRDVSDRADAGVADSADPTSADFEDGGAEGERQYRTFARAFRDAAAAEGRRVGRAFAAVRAAGETAKHGAERGLDVMRNRIRNWVLRARGFEEITPLAPGEEPSAVAPLERGDGWKVWDDASLVHHRTQLGATQANLNRVDRVWYGDPADAARPSRMGFFKPEPALGAEPPASAASVFNRTGNQRFRLAARAVMSSALDKALGTDVLADEAFAEHVDWRTGRMEMGNVSSAVDGRPLKGGAPDAALSAETGHPTIVEPLSTSIPLRSANAQRGLSDLQVLDWLTAQVDRHGGNIFMTADGTVKGIDNDLAFGPDADPTGMERNVGLPPVVHRRTADAVLALTEESFEAILDGAVPPSERLTKDGDVPPRSTFGSEMSAAKARLRALQEHLRAHPEVVVSTFDDATYDRMRAADDRARPNTYLEEHARNVEGIREVGHHDTPDYVADPGSPTGERKVIHRLVLDDPNADISSWARGAHARDAEPSRATSPVVGDRARDRARTETRPSSADRPRDRAASLGAAPAVGSPPVERAASATDEGDRRGAEASGQAETRGDERRLGDGGDAGAGRTSRYSRHVEAFGRNPLAARAAFRAEWARVALERREVAIALARDARPGDAPLAEPEDGRSAQSAERAAPEPWRHAPPTPLSLNENKGARAPTFREPRLPSYGAWRIVDDSRALATTWDKKGHVNLVAIVEYDQPLPGAHGNRGYYKPDASDRNENAETIADFWDFDQTETGWRLASRAVLTSVLDDALGTGVISREALAIHEHGRDDVAVYGNVSAQVPGKSLGERGRDFNLGQPLTQRGLTDLQVIDWISGQKDRHKGNVFVSDDGTVYGIDNDRSFGRSPNPMHGPKGMRPPYDTMFGPKNPGMPVLVHESTADAVLGMSGDALERLLQSSVPHDARLTPAEIAGARARLEVLQGELRAALNGEPSSTIVVSTFDEQTAQIAERSPTYARRLHLQPGDALSRSIDAEPLQQRIAAERARHATDKSARDAAARDAGDRAAREARKAAMPWRGGTTPKVWSEARPSQDATPSALLGEHRSADIARGAPAETATSTRSASAQEAREATRDAARNRLVEAARQVRDRARDAFREARDKLAAVMKRRPDLPAETKTDPDLASPRGSLERGSAWSTKEDADLTRAPKTLGQGVNVNRVDRVEYATPIGDSGRSTGFFKPEPERGQAPANLAQAFLKTGSPDYRLAGRAVLSSVLDRALGTHVLASEVFGEHTDPSTGKKQMGNVSAMVPGRPMREDLDEGGRTETGQPVKLARFRSDFDPRAPQTQRGLADLQALDYLTGQGDRHGGNVFIDERGEVHGIDNDLAFGPEDDPTGGSNQGLPPVVSEDAANAILALDDRALESLLTLGVPPSQRLTPLEMAAAKSRLGTLQQHLRDHPEVITSTFDDASFERLRGGRSYLENHAELLEQFASSPRDVAVYPPIDDLDPDDYTALRHVADDPGYDRARWGTKPTGTPGDSRPTIDGSPRERAGTAPAVLVASAASGADAALGHTGVEANVREGTSTSAAHGETSHAEAARAAYALKRRNHAGTSVRSDAKKTPARGTKDRKTSTIAKHRKKKG